MKKLIKKVFSTLGFKVTRINKEISNIDFDELLAQKINKILSFLMLGETRVNQ